MQSLPITTKVVSSNHANDEVYSTRHYVIKFVSDLWQVGGFLRFPSPTNMIKAKLYMNVHWMVLYNLKVFCSDMKFKMAATAGLSLTPKI